MNLIVGLIVLDGHTLHKSEVITTSGGHAHTHTHKRAVPGSYCSSFPEGLCM